MVLPGCLQLLHVFLESQCSSLLGAERAEPRHRPREGSGSQHGDPGQTDSVSGCPGSGDAPAGGDAAGCGCEVLAGFRRDRG